jgi:hypothetical protein
MMAEGKDPRQEKRKRIEATKVAQERGQRTLAHVYQDYVGKKTAKSKANTTKDREKVLKWMKGSPIWSQSIFDINEASLETTFGPLRDWLLNGKSRPAWGPRSISAGTFRKMFGYLSAAYTREALTQKIIQSRGDGPFARWWSDQPVPRPESKTTYLPTESVGGQDWLKGLVALHERMHHPDVLANRASQDSKALKPHSSVLVDFYLCVLLWGSRRTETAQLKWADIHFDDRVVIFPAESTKSGKAGAAPLTPWAVQILKERYRSNAVWRPEEPNVWVFPSRRRGMPMSEPRGIAETLNESTGLMIMPHDLRRTLATDMNKVTVRQADVGRLLLAGAALNHSRGRTGGAVSQVTIDYIKEQTEALRPTYQARENHLRRIAGLPVLAAAETVEAAAAEGTLDAVIERAKSDPETKRKLLEALLRH